MKKIYTLIAAVAIAGGVSAMASGPMLTATLSADEVEAGGNFNLTVHMKSEQVPNAMQMMVTCGYYIFAASGTVDTREDVVASLSKNFGYGVKQFLAYSPTVLGMYTADNGGYSVTFHYEVDPDTPEDTYMIRVSDVLLSYSTNDGVVTEKPNDAVVYIDVLPKSGIENVRVDAPEEADDACAPAAKGWYNLQGVRIANPTAPGLYIHDGKKVIIK